MVRLKVKEYMDRVEYLKNIKKTPQKKASLIGGNGVRSH
jgi:hypothetical protein